MSEFLVLRQMSAAIDEVRSLYADVPATTVQVFLLVAANPGISSKQLLQRAQGSQSAISRHLALLSEYSWRGGEGMDLVETVEDPEDRRNKIAFLKPKGKLLAVKLTRILNPTGPEPDPASFPTAAEYVRSVRAGPRR